MGKVIRNGITYLNCNAGTPKGYTITLPKVISGASVNRATTATLSYEFTESGTFQYCAFIYANTSVTSSVATVVLEGSTLAPQMFGNQSASRVWFCGEVEVSAGDTISVTNNVAESNAGMQFFILQDSDISKYSLIGVVGNDGTTFSLDYTDIVYLQCYQYGYYSGINTFTGYQLGVWSALSIATPSSSSYWYGGTWAIRVM